MSNILDAIRIFLVNLHPLWVYLFLSIAGLFVYWRGCTETRKDRSSIFDTFIISIVLGLLMGRVSFLSINWSEYGRYAWYFLPYERYGDTVYMFRLLPWRLFRIWDGGLTIFVAMVTFVLILTLLVLFSRKWKWYQLFFPIYFSMSSMLGLSFIYLGIIESYKGWIIRGLLLVFLPLIFWSISKILLLVIKNGVKRRKFLVYIGVLIVTLSTVYISYEYLSDSVSTFELVSVILLLLWTAVMDIYTFIEINKPNVEIEKVSSVRAVDIEINQPIRIKK
ncbi:MAG: transmembrane(s)protein [candidate division WS6 bacterium 34_10]|uniref:Transmembrane(S)protein n=1 Tax=candidate division WS6 bacterium 34_10 TaxID=1641389 RepID=A0A101HJ96_9BACT|nr:MAG: transmembrane(s)protein [candidate division WS6 bacterium 34_10]